MSSNPSVNQDDINAFMNSLKAWAKTLPQKQQDLLKRVVIKVETIAAPSGGSLSEEQLAQVAGGLRSVKDGFWVQWASQTACPG
jgi:hypothetical protein